MSNETKAVTPVEFNPETIYSMKEAKDLLDANKGQPLPGLQFYAENKAGEKTLAVVLPTLSSRGKVIASLKCLAGGPDHIRERSDWHQALRSPESRKTPKAVETVAAAV